MIERIFRTVFAFISAIFSVIVSLVAIAFAIAILGQWVSLLIWCLPLPASVIVVLVIGKVFGFSPGVKSGLIISAATATSFIWAFYLLEPNLERLPQWFLFLLAMPLDPDGYSYDRNGHKVPGMDMANLRGCIVIVSLFGFGGFIGLLIDFFKTRKFMAKLDAQLPDSTVETD